MTAPRAYYNEIDPFAAAWLRELIKDGHIAYGDVDERSIADVQPSDLAGFTQCHFFAGIGGWSLALRLAGWNDDRPVWTGSCPCQPFSSAGKGRGGTDDRHLWPHWARLILKCRPDTIFGEQVESALAHGWLDAVRDDLEAEGYAVGPVGLPAACVGAFTIRQRLWFVADRNDARRRAWRSGEASDGRDSSREQFAGLRAAERMADTKHAERRSLSVDREDGRDGPHSGRTEAHGEFGARGQICDLADSHIERREWERIRLLIRQSRQAGPEVAGSGEVSELGYSDSQRENQERGISERQRTESTRSTRVIGDADIEGSQGRIKQRVGSDERASGETSLGGFWANAEWLSCRDGKARPVEPTIFPLASGIPNRVGLLRGAGNSIVPEVAAEVISAYMEIV